MQFTLRDMALAVFVVAAFLALGRAAGQQGIGPGQRTLLAGLAVYVGGFLAIRANRRLAGIALLLGGLAIALLGAALVGGFPA